MGRAGERGDDGYQQDQAERAGGVCIGGVRSRGIEERGGDDHQQDDRQHIEKADTGGEPCAAAGVAQALGVQREPHPDEQRLNRWVKLIIATGQNNLAMNRSVLQVAKHFVHGNRLTPGMLNRVEAVIRCYDPCLSCSTHASGLLAMTIRLIDPDGTTLDQLTID